MRGCMAQAPSTTTDGSDGTREFFRQAFVTGAAVMLPLIVTLMVIGFVVDFVSKQLDPVAGFLSQVVGVTASQVVLKLLAVLLLVLAIFVVGIAAERRSGRSGLGALFDTLVSRIPGVGSLYRSIDEMSSMLLDSDTDSFRDVKLIEFPDRGTFALAFLTADTPDIVERATDNQDMVTVFLPMAPNPVMGGHVLHVAPERVYDIDLTVEEGVQSIVTSGVATGPRGEADLPDDLLDQWNERLEGYLDPEELEQYAADAAEEVEEAARDTVETAREHLPTEEDGEGTDPEERPDPSGRR